MSDNPNTREGFPPGFEFKQRTNVQQQRMTDSRDRQNKTFQDLQNFPGLKVDGDPIKYDSHGIPIVQEPEPRQNEELQQNMAPPSPPLNPQPQRPTASPTKPRIQKAEHPVLTRLRERLGITKERRWNFDLFDKDQTEPIFSFILTLIPEEVNSHCFAKAREQVLSGRIKEEEGMYYHTMLQAAAAVIAVNGYPVYEVYGVNPTPQEKKEIEENGDQYRLPNSLRKRIADHLGEFFYKDTAPIAERIQEFYLTKIAPEVQLLTTNDIEAQKLFRYVCPLDNCNEIMYLQPRYEDSEEQPYYCRIHGTVLVKADSLAREANIPLE